jgi:hypothetical protein
MACMLVVGRNLGGTSHGVNLFSLFKHMREEYTLPAMYRACGIRVRMPRGLGVEVRWGWSLGGTMSDTRSGVDE